PSALLMANAETLQLGFEHLRSSFDFEHGGFGNAPKFPNPADLTFLLHQAAAGNDEAGAMALQMLSSMADGGINDQIGGGFCRYSVDERWMIPHFEKMLYDNGQLLHLYADGWQLSHQRFPERAARYQRVIEDSVQWLLREMRSPQGAFYSSLDADSKNAQGHAEEGAFYVWHPAQLKALLTPEEFAVASRCYGFDRAANFEGHAWHAYLVGQPTPEERSLLERARSKLFAAREQRARPGRDEKILTSWNALVIKGLARAGRVLQRSDWVQAAQQAVDFIHARLWQNDRLLATCKDDTAHLNAYLDDYAFLLDALLELMQADYRSQDMEFAEDLAEALLEEFEAENGGFYFTGHHHETLIHRSKQGYDNATPSGNGIAAMALQRLGYVLGEARYLQAAERTLKAFDSSMQRNPAACASLLVALAEYLQPPALLILRGPEGDLAPWRRIIDAHYLPHLLCFALPDTLTGLPDALARPLSTAVNAWLCHGVECLPPINDVEALMAHISPSQS
ncbi:MAG TPA: thioredoxin domain-containing protein, partial [Methylophilaceae bacterium]|nr:thioredoxin domain-containing protein [Methylophilaceae bacterium]